MAPKKSKKKGKIGDDWDEEPAPDDAASVATTSTTTDQPPDGKKAPKKKAKGKKGKGKVGDWESDDDDDAPPKMQGDSDDEFRGPQKKPTKGQAKPNAAAAAFALLQDDEDDPEAAAEEEEGADTDSPKANGKAPAGFSALEASDGETSEAEEGTANGVSHGKGNGLTAASIVAVRRHPNADKLKICVVDNGLGTVEVVTNAGNAKEGMTVVLAAAGSTTPGSGMKIDRAKVRGVESSGMLCSAYDIGWVSEPDGVLVQLPASFKPGRACPDDPPEGAIFGPSSKSKEKKKSNKDLDDSFAALSVEDEEPRAVSDDEEDDGFGVPASKAKKPKKKGKKAPPSFALLGDEEEQDAAPARDPAAEDDDGAFGPPASKKKGGKKAKGGPAPSFALLGDEEEDDGPASQPAAEDDDDEDDAFGPPASKKKGGKKGKGGPAPSFAALASEEGEGEGDAGDGGELDELNLPPKRSKKKDKAKAPADELANGEANGVAEGVDDEEDLELLLASKSKKKSKKKDPAELAAAFAALGGDGDADEGGEAEENGDLGSLGKKKKKGKKKTDVDSLFAALEADASATPAAHEATPSGGDGEVRPEANGEATGKKKKKKADDMDIDALLAEVDGPKPPPPEPTAEGGEAPGKKKKKKGGKAEKKDEDLDAILAELGMAPPEPQAAAPPAEPTPDAAPAEDAAEGDAHADEGEGEAKELTAAQKKKLKKKAKEKEKKKGGGAEGEEGEEGAEVKKDKKPAKPQSAAVRRLQEELERKRIAEEQRIREEEERIRQEEEADRIREEEERRKAEEAERKKAEKREKKAELKRQGLILTGKAKKEAERLAAMREQILKNASADDAAAAAALAAGEAPVKKKVVYDTRKKKPPPKKAEDAVAADAEAQEAKRKAEQLEAEEAERKRAKVEEERLLKEQEEAAAAATAEAEAAQEESSDGDDWEAMDLDQLKLPGHEQEEAKRKAEEAAAAAAAKAAEAAAKKEAARKAAAEAAEESEEESEDEDESSDEGSSSDEDSSEEESTSYETDSEEDAAEERLRLAKEKREARLRAAQEAGSRDNLRSPICCILGHVDTGKTKLLDNIRRTSVQEGEAGGITQQIGATYVPVDAIQKRTESLRKGRDFDLKLPGLLIIDTPGHESFSNLRSRGSGLCDIAILVVDLMHGLEPQTIESINLLKMRKTPFIVALNKVDRLFDWKAHTDAPIQDSLAKQPDYVRTEFEKRLKASILNLNEQGLNVALYWKNPDPRKYVNIVPTSAITGEGIPDMLQLLVKLTQSMMSERLMFISELQCTVLEVKVVEGHGTTIDVVLVNGVLREGDTIVICGLQGPIVTSIRSLLTPHPLKELRVRGQYDHHKEVKAAQGIKIAAHGLENAVAGTQLLVLGKDDDVNVLKEEVMEDMQDIFSSVDRSGEGVCVQASTLGSLEALLEFLKSPAVKIPVSAINIGPIHKKDIMRASVMLEKGRKKFCVILAFDVPVTREAAELADKLGVRIFTADIIYHLFDQFTAYIKQVKEDEKEDAKSDASFPCELTILPTCIFNTKDPIILGVEVKEGIAKVGTPICIPSQGFMDLGKIASLELNKKSVDKAVKGDMVAMKIEATKAEESSRLYGRHFDFKDLLVSRISRKSIDVLKTHFRDDLSKDDWRLVVKLKKTFNIE